VNSESLKGSRGGLFPKGETATPRIKLQELPAYAFHFDAVLQPRDINYGGHLGNDALVSLIHAARVHLLRELGASERDLGDGKTALIMADLAVNYRAEGFLFDAIRVESQVGEISRSGFRIFHRVTRDGKVLALAETGLACFNYGERKIATLPSAFIDALARAQET
jgi:acyl-CoA thioesterase FadM